MLNLWNNYQYQMVSVNAKGQAATNMKAGLTAQFDGVAQQMAKNDPTAAMMYNRLFRYEETANIQALGGL
jgi:hypothetical protein